MGSLVAYMMTGRQTAQASSYTPPGEYAAPQMPRLMLQPMVPWCLIFALSAWNAALLFPRTYHVVLFNTSKLPLIPGPLFLSDIATCDEGLEGALFFDIDARAFVGCDGLQWTQLAYCCAPARPEPPVLSLGLGDIDERCVCLSWRPPAAHGSPVREYSLTVSTHGPSGAFETLDDRAATHERDEVGLSRSVVCRGAGLECCVAELNSSRPQWFAVTAHAVGGSSLPSEPVELHPAPVPVALDVDDDGSCTFSHGDVLRVRFDRPTNRGINGTPIGASVPSADLRRILSFSSAVGAVDAVWITDAVLELRKSASTLLLGSNGTRPLESETWGGTDATPYSDPYVARLRVAVRKEGGVIVSPPALSLPAAGTTPRVRLRNCFIDGFEASSVSSWIIESVDVSAYSVVIDTNASIVHSGSHSLRLQGGRATNFDGLKASLPDGAKPKSISFLVRASHAANVGYFTLGGPSMQESVLFFHLKPDGSAGLLSSTGAWESGPYVPHTWVHARIVMDWAYRRADLHLDGELVASAVAFASTAAQLASEVHLFNFDDGTVWWDDIVIQL